MSGRCRNLVIVLVSALCILPPAAVAQRADEIVVTTRKVEENLQDVPVAITAFDAQVIEDARIENLADVASLTPGLNFFNPFGENLPVPVIRGIAPTDVFGEPNAAVFLDGVYAAGREGLNFALLDIERIEISKGPQSALYGRNAFSGAINYISRSPSKEFSSYSEVTGGNGDHLIALGRVSGPLLRDKLGAGISVGYDTWGGSYKNPVGSDDVGGYTYKTVTSSLEWLPTERFGAVLKAYYSDDEIDDSATTGQLANCENVGPDAGANRRYANLCGEAWDLDQFRSFVNAGIVGNPNVPEAQQFTTGSEEIAKIDGSTGEEREVTRFSLNMDWDVAFGSFAALTGYSRVEHESITDGTRGLGYAFPFVYCEDVVGYVDDPNNTVPICTDFRAPQRFVAGEWVVSPRDTTKEVSQELRFTSVADRRVRYSIGGYYFQFDRERNDAAVLATSPTLPAGLGDPTGPGMPPPGAAFGPFPGVALAIGDPAYRPWFTPTSTLGQDLIDEYETESFAGFATLDWDVTEQLTADFQIRYTLEKQGVKATSPSLGATREFDKDFDFVTGRVGLRYELNDDWMAYVAISNGTKAGGFSVDAVDVIDADTGLSEPRLVIVPFDEETIISYEVGAKGTTSDGRVSLDVAIYLMDWKDIVIPQVFQNDPITGDPLEQPEGFNTNAGDATVWGMEIQGDLAFTENWFGGFGVSFTDAVMNEAKLESFAAFPTFAPDGDVSGNKVLRQPAWQVNANLRYIAPLTDAWELNTRADFIYQDEYFGGLDNQWTIPGHTYVNLRLALESFRWTIALWAKNLFDDDAPVAGFRDVYFGNTDDILQQQPASSTPQKFFPWRITVTQPTLRTYGLTIGIKFGAAQ